MKLPDGEYLDIGHLSRILDRNRITNSYKLEEVVKYIASEYNIPATAK